MTTFHEQMKNAREADDGRTIRDYPSWTLEDYRDFMFCVEKGYLVQDWSSGNLFIINQEWEGDDIYDEEFGEEVENCIKCGTTEKLRDYHLSAIGQTGIVKTCSPCGRTMTTEFVEKVEDPNYSDKITAQELREKIGAWLSDKTNHEGDLVDFLCDECGVEYQYNWEEQDADDIAYAETDCLCGNNHHKGWLDKVGGDMICEDCDIGGCNQMISEDN